MIHRRNLSGPVPTHRARAGPDPPRPRRTRHGWRTSPAGPAPAISTARPPPLHHLRGPRPWTARGNRSVPPVGRDTPTGAGKGGSRPFRTVASTNSVRSEHPGTEYRLTGQNISARMLHQRAVMIAEDFRPVRTTLASRSPTESLAVPRVEGARARTGRKDRRGRGQRSVVAQSRSETAITLGTPRTCASCTSGLVQYPG